MTSANRTPLLPSGGSKRPWVTLNQSSLTSSSSTGRLTGTIVTTLMMLCADTPKRVTTYRTGIRFSAQTRQFLRSLFQEDGQRWRSGIISCHEFSASPTTQHTSPLRRGRLCQESFPSFSRRRTTSCSGTPPSWICGRIFIGPRIIRPSS